MLYAGHLQTDAGYAVIAGSQSDSQYPYISKLRNHIGRFINRMKHLQFTHLKQTGPP
ncbi:hypothetical protein SCFA_640032 [anaerobic digester metagenome]|uniref:Transposase n=1 Tax=anaerobic digester metagenome TaxID=1263854 RepID=A0A485M3G9_9ZZZZ